MNKDPSQISDKLVKARAVEIIKVHKLAELSDGKLKAIFELIHFVKSKDLFYPPFRLGHSEPFNILDKNGRFVAGFNSKKSNARSKSILLLELLNTFFTANDGL